jgi:putative ABC transport system permease protein
MIGVRIMMGHRFWRTAAKIAWRDLHASRGQSVFILAAMAVSLAGAGGVHSAARAAREFLLRDARSWLAGDVCVDTGEPIGDDQVAALDRLRAGGTEWTLVTWVITMAASDQSPDAGYIAVKAIDPQVYPFHGSFTTEPPEALRNALDAESALVSEATLERLQVHRGDTIRIGGKPFRIAASFRTEPERYAGIYSFGMRCILSQEGYARTGIARGGNPPRNRILLRLPAGADLATARQWLQELVPEGKVSDYRDANRQEVSRFEAAATFLNITAFLALVLGCGGVAIAVRRHVEQGMYKLAIVKVVGGRSSQISSIFTMQILWLMAGALAVGIPLGIATRAPLLWMLRQYVDLPATPAVDFRAILESAAVAVLALCPVLAQPFAAARRARPAQLLRGYAAWAPRPAEAAGPALFSCAVLAVVAWWMLGSWKTALLLGGALVAALAIAAASTSLLLRLIRIAIHSCAPAGSSSLRLGLMNLYRPGNRTGTILVSLAMGFLMMIATFQSAAVVVRAIAETMPYVGFDLLVAGFEEAHRIGVETFLRAQPGVAGVQTMTQTRMRLTKVDGVPLQLLSDTGGGTWHVVYCSDAPAHGGTPRVTVADDLARKLGIGAGSRLEFASKSGVREVVVSGTRVLQASERFWFTFSVDCNSMEGLSLFHQAAVRVKPGRLAEVRANLNAKYPSLAVIAPEEIAETIRAVTANAAWLVRFIAFYAIGSGLCVLIAIVSASRNARLREIAILSALGATRSKILRMSAVEFCAIGLLAGAMGSLAGCAVAAVILGEIFHRLEFAPDWAAAAGAVVFAAAATFLAGWLPAYRLLRRKPLESLRGE